MKQHPSTSQIFSKRNFMADTGPHQDAGGGDQPREEDGGGALLPAACYQPTGLGTKKWKYIV